MHSQHLQVSQLLGDVTRELQKLGLWNTQTPSADALASGQPFCIDTLHFEQWLQFVFIERMAVLVEQQQPLPTSCAIAPMAEEAFRGLDATHTLLNLLRTIDEVLS